MRATQASKPRLSSGQGRVARVLPDVPALDRDFHYLVPDSIPDIFIGDLVRVPLQRRVERGWVIGLDEEPPPDIELVPIIKRLGYGPPQSVLDIVDWAAWRWAGPRPSFLRVGMPSRYIAALPEVSESFDKPSSGTAVELGSDVPKFADLFDVPLSLVRLGPMAERLSVVQAAVQRGHTLVLVPSLSQVASLGRQLRRLGYKPALLPEDWAQVRAGASLVLGSRAGALAPMPQMDSVVIFDEHDEVWQQEAAPTWNARDLVIERAKGQGASTVLVSPVPSLEALALTDPKKMDRATERRNWPKLVVIDRREEDPRHKSLWSEAVVSYLRGDGPVLCVLNRLGRARLLSCKSCGNLATCEACGSSMEQIESHELRCRRCSLTRPIVCQACGGSGFKNLRVGLSRAHEELEVLIGTQAVQVSAATPFQPSNQARVYIGTEAILHQIPRAAAVVFLDFDQELLAPRYRAAEEALALLTRAARIVGRHFPPGNLIVQTRLPDHEVLRAVHHADPEIFSKAELSRRKILGFPPVTALAEISGAAAAEYIEGLVGGDGVQVLGPNDGRWLIRAPNPTVLADFLAQQKRPEGRLRIAVDPPRV